MKSWKKLVKTTVLLTTVIMVCWMLTGCEGLGNASPTPTPTTAPTVAPTTAPTVAPTVAPTAVPTEAPRETRNEGTGNAIANDIDEAREITPAGEKGDAEGLNRGILSEEMDIEFGKNIGEDYGRNERVGDYEEDDYGKTRMNYGRELEEIMEIS